MKMVVASLVLFYFGGQDITMSTPPSPASCASDYDCPSEHYCYEGSCYDECHPDDKDCRDC
mgnify:CR=1 FL=1